MTFLHREVFAKAEYLSRVRVLMRQGQAVWNPRTFPLPLLLKYGSCTAAKKRFTFTALFLSFSLPLLPTGLLSRFILRYCSYDVYNDRGAEPGGTAVDSPSLPGRPVS